MANKAVTVVLVSMMLLTGVCNTLLTKYQDMQCVADCDTSRPKLFEQPVIQTLQMFVGESGCWLVVLFSAIFTRLRRRPASYSDIAYQPVNGEDRDVADEEETPDLSSSQTLVDPTNVIAKPAIDGQAVIDRKPLKGWKVTLLAMPAICDIIGTTLMNAGLLFVAASIYQMTRGALVLFVGLLSVLFLKHHLNGWKWMSLFVVVLGVAIVGLAGVLEKKNHPSTSPDDPDMDANLLIVDKIRRLVGETLSTAEAHTAAETVLGVFMIATAQIFTATQFVTEESIMKRYSMDPIQVVGWEGVFGFLVTLAAMGILHGAIGQTPAGKGGYFDARAAFHQVLTNPVVAVTSFLIMISIGGFNFFGLSVTRQISATSRSTIDTCRTLFIWIVSLALHWETFKWLQVLGFALLVWATAVFNDILRPPTLSFLRRRTRQPISLESNS